MAWVRCGGTTTEDPPTTGKALMLVRVLPGLNNTSPGVDDVYGTPYNFVRFRPQNRDTGGWDVNLDGHLDSNFSNSSAFLSTVNSINNGAHEYIAFDWEVRVSPNTGTSFWEDDVSGRNGTTRQAAALADGIAVTNAYKAACPGKKFGWYLVPKQFNESGLSTPLSATVLNWPTSMQSLWEVVDFIAPDIYQRYKVITSGSPGTGEITVATDLDRMTNFANLCLDCAAASGRDIPVIPFITDNYVAGVTGSPYPHTEVPNEEFYGHVKRFMQTTRNGVRPFGCMWWETSTASLGYDNIVEDDVKAVYQAINLLSPYDANFPRPS
jgi:hypothetical protein